MRLTEGDDERFRTIIQRLIDTEGLQKFKAFVNETEKKRKRRNDLANKEAREASAVLSKYGEGSLAAMIQRNQENRNQVFELFAAFWCCPCCVVRTLKFYVILNIDPRRLKGIIFCSD